MRKLFGIVVVIAFAALSAFASAKSDHVEHLRAMLKVMSNHGAVVPQPESVQGLATLAITVTSRAFSFSPGVITVDQGDVVTLTVTTPSGDAGAGGHGILMETYIEEGIDSPTGGSSSKTFTATTPGTFAFVCTNASCGTGHSSMFGQFIVRAVSNPSPTISSIFPTSGSTAGGTTVIISGSNFQTSGTTTVRFDTTPATEVNVTSSTSIRVVTPPHAEQTLGVRVTNPDGQTVTLPQGFTFVTPGPRIDSVSPNTGSTAGGTPITISGGGFVTGARVTIGGVDASNVVVTSGTSLSAATPLGPANEQVNSAKDVVVTNPDGLSATRAGAFTYFVPSLSVVSITPNVGATGGGTVVRITGAGFTTAVTSSVSFGGVAATNIRILDAVTLEATAPAHAAGVVDVVVTVGGGSVTRTGAFTYQATQPRRRATRH